MWLKRNSGVPLSSRELSAQGLLTFNLRPTIDALEANYDRIVGDLRSDSMPFVDVKVWASEATFYREMMELLRVVYSGTDGYVNGGGELHVRLLRDVEVYAVHEFAYVAAVSLSMYRVFYFTSLR